MRLYRIRWRLSTGQVRHSLAMSRQEAVQSLTITRSMGYRAYLVPVN